MLTILFSAGAEDCEEFLLNGLLSRRPGLEARIQRVWHLTFASLPPHQLSARLRAVLKTSASSGIRKQVPLAFFPVILKQKCRNRRKIL
jgi:hypothetical protein